MTETASLFGPVAMDIPLVRERLLRIAYGHHELLEQALTYVFETVGKRIRPALVLLTGKLGSYDSNELVTLATSIELVHTATLVHDDTVDQALSRRGLATVNAIWDPKIAILLGDYLFAQSAKLATQLDRRQIMELLSDTVMAMSSGELRQYAASQTISFDEKDYFERIVGKTASLFAMCCQGGAIVSKQTSEQIAAMRSFGVNLGLAFQIADDVLDFVGDQRTLGKPAGSDLRQGTVTLPLILYARDVPSVMPRLQLSKGHDDVDEIVEAVRESDAPARALVTASEYAAAARGTLHLFPESDAKHALRDLTEYVIHRNR